MLLCMWKYGSQLLHIYGILQKIEKKNPKTNPWFLSKCPPRNDKKKREKIFNVCASVFFFSVWLLKKFDETAPLQKMDLKNSLSSKTSYSKQSF